MKFYNQKTKLTSSIIGSLLGLGGIINHGVFEILQGDTPTNGFFIEAISETHRYWIHGTEGAFTIIPNFLYTGILAIIVGFLVILWSIKFIHHRHGSTVFLVLMLLLTSVGGGIGHVILFLPTWGFSTRINKPLSWWMKVLPLRLRNILSKLWIYGILISSISWLIVMELGIFGYFPGQSDPDKILNIVFIFIFSSVIFTCFTYICSFSNDINKRNQIAFKF